MWRQQKVSIKTVFLKRNFKHCLQDQIKIYNRKNISIILIQILTIQIWCQLKQLILMKPLFQELNKEFHLVFLLIWNLLYLVNPRHKPRNHNWSGVRWNCINIEIKKNGKKLKTSIKRSRVFQIALKSGRNENFAWGVLIIQRFCQN